MDWNVEEMKLLNEKHQICLGNNLIYSCEDIDRDEKISFIDKMYDGKMSYLLNLITKFNSEKESLPKNNFGNIKTTSLKAWIKRNDFIGMIDSTYHYGKIRFLSLDRWIETVNHKGDYDVYEDIVDECFYKALLKCESKEKEYFLEHDEYSILKKQFRDKSYNTTFGVHISSWSNGRICVCNDDDNDIEREITLDELKLLLSKYEELDKLVEKITKEIDIIY